MPPKRLKNFLEALSGDRLSVVPDLQNKVMLISNRGDLYRALRCTMSQGIADQVGGDLLNAAQVASDSTGHVDAGNDLSGGLPVLKLLYDGL